MRFGWWCRQTYSELHRRVWWMSSYFIHKYNNSVCQTLWIIVEIKSLNKSLSSSLLYFVTHAWAAASLQDCGLGLQSHTRLGWKAFDKCPLHSSDLRSPWPTWYHPPVEICLQFLLNVLCFALIVCMGFSDLISPSAMLNTVCTSLALNWRNGLKGPLQLASKQVSCVHAHNGANAPF